MLTKTYSGSNVLVTGHTGFKGSWLAAFLHGLGSNVFGLSNSVSKNRQHSYHKLDIPSLLSGEDTSFDVRNLSDLEKIAQSEQFDFVFHLAASAIVSDCIDKPLDAFTTNAIGLANVLETFRTSVNPPTLVLITSDKCYLPDESRLPYKETHYMGGYDPYSASKASAEVMAQSMIHTYPDSWRNGVATARAGNVFGGGDWSPNRLVPDIVRMMNDSSEVVLRLPSATRPWTYVLDVLSGYLKLGAALRAQKVQSKEAWNFASGERMTVADFTKIFLEPRPDVSIMHRSSDLFEVNYLELDSTKARNALGWAPLAKLESQIQKTFEWYSAPTDISSLELKYKFLEPYLEI